MLNESIISFTRANLILTRFRFFSFTNTWRATELSFTIFFSNFVSWTSTTVDGAIRPGSPTFPTTINYIWKFIKRKYTLLFIPVLFQKTNLKTFVDKMNKFHGKKGGDVAQVDFILANDDKESSPRPLKICFINKVWDDLIGGTPAHSIHTELVINGHSSIDVSSSRFNHSYFWTRHFVSFEYLCK